jgi:hypothetical protein
VAQLAVATRAPEHDTSGSDTISAPNPGLRFATSENDGDDCAGEQRLDRQVEHRTDRYVALVFVLFGSRDSPACPAIHPRADLADDVLTLALLAAVESARLRSPGWYCPVRASPARAPLAIGYVQFQLPCSNWVVSIGLDDVVDRVRGSAAQA